jgi:hypothetical protein
MPGRSLVPGVRMAAGAAALAALGACAPRLDPTRPTIRRPLTRAESSGYTQTSSYGDVIAFINTLRALNAPVAYGTIGTTTDGRAIPYLIASRPVVTTPEEARRLGRPIVYVNANIHAGEVEGKEALLALVRDLVYQRRANVLDSLVLIAVPIYNADGNEAFAPESVNRTEQNGPPRVGQRPNGQGYDLNRDYMKAEAPETRASLAMFTAWDPDVYVDLHTTDGSYHGFALTYSPSLAPPAYAPGFAGDFTRDTLLPEIRARMDRRGVPVFDYGNFDSVYEEHDITDTVKHGWYTYDHRPRFGTNYYGLRGRVSILSEAYSHDPFRKRVASTYAFVQEILSATARHAATLAAIRASADSVRDPEVAIRSRLTTHPFEAPIPFEVLVHTGDSAQTQPGVPRGIRRTGRFITQLMPVYDRFEPVLAVSRPAGYVIPAGFPAVVDVLRRNGIPMIPAKGDERLHAQVFIVDSVAHAARPFQKHDETRVTGHWRDTTITAPAGALIVPATGRLGALTAYFLEPESDDGFLDWNFFDTALAAGRPYPVARLLR